MFSYVPLRQLSSDILSDDCELIQPDKDYVQLFYRGMTQHHTHQALVAYQHQTLLQLIHYQIPL